jgi:hypothetical protein
MDRAQYAELSTTEEPDNQTKLKGNSGDGLHNTRTAASQRRVLDKQGKARPAKHVKSNLRIDGLENTDANL